MFFFFNILNIFYKYEIDMCIESILWNLDK